MYSMLDFLAILVLFYSVGFVYPNSEWSFVKVFVDTGVVSERHTRIHSYLQSAKLW